MAKEEGMVEEKRVEENQEEAVGEEKEGMVEENRMEEEQEGGEEGEEEDTGRCATTTQLTKASGLKMMIRVPGHNLQKNEHFPTMPIPGHISECLVIVCRIA